MNLLFRLIAVLLGAWRAPRLHPLDVSVVGFRVLPTDLDLNLHMNNGRYLTLMDLGRLDLILRAGTAGVLRRNRWAPVVAGQMIRYRRSLEPFQRYELHTRLLGWDDRSLFLEQRFVRAGETTATALVRAAVRGPEGRVTPERLAAEAGYDFPSPPLPDSVHAWLRAEDGLAANPPEAHG